ncbi:hypothetical protein HDV06_002289 [Boothiomyces sp. JEL0866]|nr:hypothetical protein HDV06_002289 [Boothiomyces sp. JEL0866]
MLSFCLLLGASAAFQINSYKDMLQIKFAEQIKDRPLIYQYFDQQIDHNDASRGTFKQRFYVDDEFYDSAKGGPIFLEMGGESSINATFLPYELHYELAQRYNGLLIILEHRYYGDDGLNPFAQDLGILNLKSAMKTFTVDQALADGYTFIKSYSKQVNSKSRWIAVGGSYPGNLAAWMRLKYPDVVYAAHSSSAPVLAKPDFWEYGYAVDIGLAKSGGSDACATGWRRAVKLNDAHTSSPVIPSFSRIMSSVVQYGRSAKLYLGGSTVKLIDYVCSGNYLTSFINPNASDQEALDDYYSLFSTFKNQPNEQSIITQDDLLLWLYQGCNEWGYFQLSESPHQTAFSSKLDLKSSLSSCNQLFGLNGPNADLFNSNYKGLAITNYTTNIVFVHGTVDPWSYLGINSVGNSSNTFIQVQGGHHCSDLYKITNSSTDEAKRIHGLILNAWDSIMNQTSAPAPLMTLPPSSPASSPTPAKPQGSASSFSLVSAFVLIAINILI